MPADAVAVDQHAPIAEVLGTGIVEGVQQLAGEAVQPAGSTGARNRPDATITASNGSPSTIHAGRRSRTRVSNRIRSVTPKRVGVRAQVLVDLLGQGVQIVRAAAPGNPRTRSSPGWCSCACPARSRCAQPRYSTARRGRRSPRTRSPRTRPRSRASPTRDHQDRRRSRRRSLPGRASPCASPIDRSSHCALRRPPRSTRSARSQRPREKFPADPSVGRIAPNPLIEGPSGPSTDGETVDFSSSVTVKNSMPAEGSGGSESR